MSVRGKQARKQAHAIFKSIKCFSAAQVEKLSHSKGSVSPQLQSGRSLCVLQRSVLFIRKSDWETRNCEAAPSMKSVSSCLCAVQCFSPRIHTLRSILKSSFVASKTSISRFYIRSCHMLLKPKVVLKNC